MNGIIPLGVVLLACGGSAVVLALVAGIALAAGRRRGRRESLNGPVLQQPTMPPFEDDDFGGVPTTGPVQEYERDYRPENIIGSSGFDAQTYEDTDETDNTG